MLVACLLAPQVEQTSPGTSMMFAYVGSFTTAQCKARLAQRNFLDDYHPRGDGIHVYRAVT